MGRGATILMMGLLTAAAAGGLALAQTQTTPAKARAEEVTTQPRGQSTPAQAPSKAPSQAGPQTTPAKARAQEATAQAPTKPAAPAAPSSERTLLSVKDVMRHIINPAAETYWAHSGEVDDDKGANDRVPTAQAEWNINIDTAAQIAEAGNLLMMDGRARDPNGPWMKYAIALNKAGIAGMAAATAHDHDKTNDAGSAMYDACFQCHGRYIPRPKNSLYTHNIDQDLADAEKAKAAAKAAGAPPPK
jgi:hypothetical protein